MEKLFNRYREHDFSEFKGIHLDATLPITEVVLNDVVQEFLGAHNDNVQHLRISIRDQNTLNVDVRVKLGFLAKTFNFDAIVGEQIDFQASPKLKISLSGSGLPLGILARIANKIFGVLPEGVNIVGRTIEVNLSTMLSNHGLHDILPLLKVARIETISEKLILHLRIELN